MNLYRCESSNAKWNAQRNLSGRTHYVDDDTLRFHKSRVLQSGTSDQGLIFWLVESVALVMDGSKRGFRFVLFDIFGNTIERPSLEDSYRTAEQARRAMWDALNKISGMDITNKAIDDAERHSATEYANMRETVAKMSRQAA
jgi:hypothetical protein